MEKFDNNQSEEPTDNYTEIKEEQEVQALLKRFSNQNFCDQYAWAKWSALITSYLIQILSIGLASFGVYWFLTKIIPYPTIGMILTIIILGLCAFGQRKTSDALWDGYMKTRNLAMGLLLICLVFLAFSMGSSSYGNYIATQEMNKGKAALITHDTTLNWIENQLAIVNSDIAASKATTWAGKITRSSQRAIEKSTPNKTNLTATVIDRKLKNEEKNEAILNQHEEDVMQTAKISIGIYLFLEILFEACMAFCSYYDYRKLTEKFSKEELTKRLNNKLINAPNKDNKEIRVLSEKVDDLTQQLAQQAINPNGQYFNNNFVAPPDYYQQNPINTPPNTIGGKIEIKGFLGRSTPVRPKTPPIAVKSVPHCATAPHSTNSAGADRIKIQLVDIKALERDVSTYYTRSFLKKEVGPNGSKFPETCKDNKKRVEIAMEQLEQNGRRAIVNFEKYEKVEFYDLEESVA